MNEKKFSFIMCCNNDYYLQEAKTYLEELIIPEGYEVDFVEVRGAKSMTSGCNEGMRRSDAKYKIYMHQDVFIINKNFLADLLAVFNADASIGLVGMVGTPYMVKDGTMWHGIRFGSFYKLEEGLNKGVVHRFFPFSTGYMEVEAVDGLLMATQYDVPWREDIFTKWDFYDVSQSFEFLRTGYKVVVPGQAPEWYIHDCGIINLGNYDGERDKFLEEYSEYMDSRQQENWETYLEVVRQRIRNGFYGTDEEKEQLLDRLVDLTDE